MIMAADDMALQKALVAGSTPFLSRHRQLNFSPINAANRLSIIKKARKARNEMRNYFDPGIVNPKIGKGREHIVQPIDKTQRLGGRYQIIGEMKSGSSSIVYKAWDYSDKRLKAIKVLSPQVHSEVQVRRFVREAVALASLDHRNIINVEDVSWNNGNPYLVLEHIENARTFNELVDEFHSDGVNAGSLNLMLHYFADLCDALEYLHERPEPIIHRDLKPKNVLVSSGKITDRSRDRNIIKLADFGLSSVSGGTLTTLTKLNDPVIGTPHYAAIPDIVQEGHFIDNRADLYSLGVMLYEAIVGHIPFSGVAATSKTMQETTHNRAAVTPHVSLNKPDPMASTIDRRSDSNSNIILLIDQHKTEKPDFSYVLEGIPKDMINLTAKLLEKDPNDRIQTAGEVADRLRAIASSLSIQASIFLS